MVDTENKTAWPRNRRDESEKRLADKPNLECEAVEGDGRCATGPHLLLICALLIHQPKPVVHEKQIRN